MNMAGTAHCFLLLQMFIPILSVATRLCIEWLSPATPVVRGSVLGVYGSESQYFELSVNRTDWLIAYVDGPTITTQEIAFLPTVDSGLFNLSSKMMQHFMVSLPHIGMGIARNGHFFACKNLWIS